MSISRIGFLLLPVLLLGTPVEAQTAKKKLTLQQARRMALENHPQIKAATLSALAADQVTKQLKATRLPVVQVNVTGAGASEDATIAAGSLSNSSVANRAATGFTLNQLIYDFGRTGSRVESSRARANALEETAVATRAQILLQVDRTYYNALRAEALLKVAEETAKTRQVVLEQTEALQESGIRSGLDVSLASYNVAEARLLIARSENDVQSALAELSFALGSGEEHEIDLAEIPLISIPLPDRKEVVHEALAQRPELKSLRFERDAAYQSVRTEKAARKPAINAIWSAGWIPVREDLRSAYNAAAINFGIPIFNRELSARQTEAEYRARAAEEQLKEAENRIARDVRLAWYSTDNARQRIELAAQLLATARESLDLAQERYRLGLASIVELSQAVLNFTVAEIEGTSVKFDYLIQRSVLDFQIGRLD